MPLGEKSTTTPACSLGLARSFSGTWFSQPLLPLVFPPAVMINTEPVIVDGFANALPTYMSALGHRYIFWPALQCLLLNAEKVSV